MVVKYNITRKTKHIFEMRIVWSGRKVLKVRIGKDGNIRRWDQKVRLKML